MKKHRFQVFSFPVMLENEIDIIVIHQFDRNNNNRKNVFKPSVIVVFNNTKRLALNNLNRKTWIMMIYLLINDTNVMECLLTAI